MYHYSKYIVKNLTHSTLLITFSLTSIVWLTQALRFIDFIVNQGVSIMVFLQLTVLLIPSLLLMILPPALFCSVIFVYNKLKLDSELIVLQAAGLSRLRLSIPAVQVAMVIAMLSYFVAMVVQPVSYTKFRDMQLFLKNNYASILLQEGVFSNPVRGLTVFIRERSKDGILHGILVHDNRQMDAPITMIADEGKMVETPQGPRFLLLSGNRQEMRGGRMSFLTFDNYTMDISLYTQSAGDRTPDAQEMSLADLFRDDPKLQPNENQRRHAEGHQRILWPLYSLSLTLVALAVLLSGEFNRRGQWKRIAIAISIGVIIIFAAVSFRGLMATKPILVYAAYVNLIAPIIVALWALSDRSQREMPLKQLAGSTA